MFEVRSGEEEYDGGCVGVGEVDCGRGGVGRLPLEILEKEDKREELIEKR